MLNALLMEKVNIKPLAVPSSVNGAAITGARVKLDSGERVAIVITMGASTSAVVEFALKQHTAASGGSSKELSVDNPYFYQKNTDTSFTKVDIGGSAASTYTLTTHFTNYKGVVILEVLADQLDIKNGYYWVSCDIADTTAAKVIGGLYLIHENKKLPAYDIAL